MANIIRWVPFKHPAHRHKAGISFDIKFWVHQCTEGPEGISFGHRIWATAKIETNVWKFEGLTTECLSRFQVPLVNRSSFELFSSLDWILVFKSILASIVCKILGNTRLLLLPSYAQFDKNWFIHCRSQQVDSSQHSFTTLVFIDSQSTNALLALSALPNAKEAGWSAFFPPLSLSQSYIR